MKKQNTPGFLPTRKTPSTASVFVSLVGLVFVATSVTSGCGKAISRYDLATIDLAPNQPPGNEEVVVKPSEPKTPSGPRFDLCNAGSGVTDFRFSGFSSPEPKKYQFAIFRDADRGPTNETCLLEKPTSPDFKPAADGTDGWVILIATGEENEGCVVESTGHFEKLNPLGTKVKLQDAFMGPTRLIQNDALWYGTVDESCANSDGSKVYLQLSDTLPVP